MLFTAANKVYTSTNKTSIFSIETELSLFFFFFFSFLPGVDASHVYVRALALGCFYSHVSSTRTFRRALTASVDNCAETECPFSGVTKFGRVWRKVPESDARSVPSGWYQDIMFANDLPVSQLSLLIVNCKSKR